MGRLCAFLRQRKADDNIGYSILIYRLTSDDLQKALFGPPAELDKTSRATQGFDRANEIEACNNRAWLLATSPNASIRDGAAAIELARRANQLSENTQPGVLDTLAAAYAEAGRFPEALATARKALGLAKQQNDQALADVLRTRIALYETGKPYREVQPTPTPRPRTP